MPRFIERRQFIASMAALGTTGLVGLPARAQEAFPTKGPIKVIVPLPAGGAADATARMVVASLQAQLKQTFIVDNRPGASYAIAMQAMRQAPADGYTLIHVSSGMCAAQVTLKKIDLLETLAPVSLMGTMPAVLLVPASSPFKSVKDLVDAGAAKPGSLAYGSIGIGTLEHLWPSQFSKANKLDAVHVPFKGGPDAVTALAAGEIQFMTPALALGLPMIQKGLIRALALLDKQRHPLLPDVPTLQELGHDMPSLVLWGGFAAVRGTPAPVIEQLRAAVATAVADADVKSKLIGIGTTAFSSTPQAFEALITQELGWMNAAVKAANLQLN
ncbi:MAG: tripartite tricarboxylate transporter substrate binding protein [Burkholderiaceae bacterium]